MESIYLNYSLNYPNLEKALKSGAKMHCFLSGGSLRVIRIENSDELISYGEYPYFPGALVHAESDFGLTYEEQYGGKNAKHEHYLTGAYPLPHDYFDTYLKMGKQFDILYSNQKNQFVCISEFGKGKVIWGSSSNILSSIMDCLLFRHSYTGDKDSFMETIHTD